MNYPLVIVPSLITVSRSRYTMSGWPHAVSEELSPICHGDQEVSSIKHSTKLFSLGFMTPRNDFSDFSFQNFKLCLRLSFVLQKWSLLLTSDLIKNHFLDYHFIELHFEETQLGFRTQYITIHSKQLNDAFLQLKVVLFIMISHFHMKTFVYFQQATTLLFCIASTPLVFVASNV